MAFGNGPRIVTDGLVLSLDAGDRNSLSDEPAINLIENNPIPVSTSGFTFSGPTSFTMSYNATEQAIEFESDNTAVWGWYVWNNSLNTTPLSTSSLYSTSFEWKVGSRNTYTSSLSHQIIRGDGTTGSFGSPNFTTNASSQTGSYARVSYTFTPASAGVDGDRQYRIIGQSFASGSSRIHLFWRKLQLEQNDHSTTFVSGSRNTWVDLSGNNNNGTLVNNPLYNSGSRGNIVFNGTNNTTFAATINSVGMYQSNFSNEFWFNPSSITQGALLSANGSPVAGGQYAVLLRYSNIFVSFYGEDQNVSLLSTNIWYHFTNTYNYTTKSSLMYINGTLSSTITRTFDLGASVQNSPLLIGNYSFGGTYFSGSLASTKIYNRALSASEILQNYNAQKSRFNL
jgi:hypothetical protein